MSKISQIALGASLSLFTSGPALAHPGHGPDNLILHRLVHWAGSADTALLLALGTTVLAVTLAAALLGMRRRAERRK
jgi:hypothetical protein